MSPHDPRHQLEATADAHWDRYLSAVTTGGTPEQRQWAFDRWLEHDQALARHDRHARNQATRERARQTTDPALPAVQGPA